VASHHLQRAHDLALSHFILGYHAPSSSYYGEQAIRSLKDAAEAFGFEIIQRVTPAAETVPDGARDA
jgi:hypothetical protein